jgi:hypothetical protein
LRAIGYEALDNGILSCEDPKRAQALCERKRLANPLLLDDS